MKKSFCAVLVLMLAFSMAFIGCDTGGGSTNQTPVAGDFTISGTGTFTYDGNAKFVTVSAQSGKTNGAVTVKYNENTTAPSSVGSYAVTFDVAEAAGWNAANGLYAGMLIINAGAAVAMPTVTPAGGTYNEAQNVTLSCDTGGAHIFFTLNGDDPITHSNTIYSGVITISVTTTLKAVAIKDDIVSDVLTVTYTINDAGKSTGATVASPTLASRTDTIITVNAVSAPGNGQSVEYAINTNSSVPGSGWQDGLTFHGLTAETAYYIFARSKENDTHNAGTPSAGLQVTTDSAGIKMVVTNTDEWNAALTSVRTGGNGTAGSPKAYTITINGDVLVSGTAANSFGTVSNITVTMNGNGKLYIIGQGSLLTITNNQTVYIDSDNLVLEGLKTGQNGSATNNNRAVVYVAGGTLELLNGTISGNTISGSTTGSGGGVHVTSGTMIGKFAMSGGTIRDNTISGSTSTTSGSGGVYITGSNSSFTMSGGIISGNTVSSTSGSSMSSDAGIGGGVCVSGTNSSFTMTGGTISGNTGGSSNYVLRQSVNSYVMTTTSGGGVYVSNDCDFTMSGGIIGGNTGASTGNALSSGYVKYNYSGGGVFVAGNGTFAKTGGIIYGNNEGTNSNTSTSTFGNGNAVYFASPGLYRDATLGGGDTISTSDLSNCDPPTLSVNTWADDNIPQYGEHWFRFTATAGTQYIHGSAGTASSFTVQLYDSNGNTVGSRIDFGGVFYASRTLTIGQLYYVLVRPNSSLLMSNYYNNSASGTYRIGFNDTRMPPVAGSITTLSADTWADGNIPQYGEQWFTFTATADTQYIHASFGTLTDLYVQVYDSSGSTVGSQMGLSSSTTCTSMSLTSGQVYCIQVTPASRDYTGTYKIGFNDTLWPPEPVLLSDVNTWANGSLVLNGEQWFTFIATAETQYIHFSRGTLSFSGTSDASLFVARVTVYDSNNSEDAPQSFSFFAASSDYKTVNLTIGQVYYMRVRSGVYTTSTNSGNNWIYTDHYSSGTYRIAFNTSPTPPAP